MIILQSVVYKLVFIKRREKYQGQRIFTKYETRPFETLKFSLVVKKIMLTFSKIAYTHIPVISVIIIHIYHCIM